MMNAHESLGHCRLAPHLVELFDRDGFLARLNVFSRDEAVEMRRKFEAFEARLGKEQAMAQRTDLHLLQRWAWDVVTDPRVVDPIISILGPNVLLWSLNWFVKEPGDRKFVSPHQDANYWGLEPHDVVTAWIAISDAAAEMGPLEFLPGSHKGELYSHEYTVDEDNMLSRGQTIRGVLNEETGVLAPLRAGEMSLHHVRVVHASGPNLSGDRRIGLVVRFCATHVRQTKIADTAVLVAGEDTYGHFELLPPPEVDFGEDEKRRHADSVQRLFTVLKSD